MKTIKILIITFITVCLFLPAIAECGDIKSLRGATPIDADSNTAVEKKWQADQPAIARTFKGQPPLIPHSIADYTISLQENGCMECHGDPDSGAPKLSVTHYTDRDGKKLEKVSAARYFCTQCHVQQVDATPLVENTFSTGK